MTTIIAYHKFCRDGWSAALVAYDWYTKHTKTPYNLVFVQLLPEEVPNACKKLLQESPEIQVRLFDLAITQEDAMSLLNHFTDCWIADHHKTTALSFGCTDDFHEVCVGGSKFIFDNNKCGAVLAWAF